MKIKSFPGKKSNENILFVIRKHGIIHFLGILRLIFVAIIPFCGSIVFIFWLKSNRGLGDDFFFNGIAFSILTFCFLFFFCFLWWVNDDLDVAILTDYRLIDINQIHFLEHRMTEIGLEKIHDISGTLSGISGAIFRYGTLQIYTARDHSDFKMQMVATPRLVARKILDFVHLGLKQK